MIVALIPAHNEEAGIVQTIKSLQKQTHAPDKIIVSADNCSDNTVPLARMAGAEVYETVGNTHKKAGALNQALEFILPSVGPDDFILVLDADGVLSPDWIEVACQTLEPSMGAISGVCVVRDHPGILPLLQGAEYAQDFRRVARNKGNPNVLSGAAAMFTYEALADLLALRGRVFDEKSLTEDFEITLTLKMLGFKPRCSKYLVVTTDVMTTWRDLYRQRLRWQRGTLETLHGIGYNKVTRKMFWTIGLCYLATILMALTIILWGAVVAFSLGVNYVWLAVIPIFMIEQGVTAKHAGPKAAAVAASMIPMFVYGLFRSWVYWVALFKAVRNTDKVWVT